MVRRSPGRTCSSDGTFRLMNRTITDANVLVLIIGDDHCIVAYYVVRAEMWADLVPGLEGLRTRLSRLGTLHLLQEWWSDRQSFYLFAFKCPQPPAQSKQDCTTSMQEHQSG